MLTAISPISFSNISTVFQLKLKGFQHHSEVKNVIKWWCNLNKEQQYSLMDLLQGSDNKKAW